MHLFHIILPFFVFILASCTDVEVGIEGFGSGISNTATANTDERKVTVVNSYDKKISLYWESPDETDDEVYLMFTMEVNGTVGMNTYNGHRFYSKETGTSERLPYVIDVNEASATYTIGGQNEPTEDVKIEIDQKYKLPSNINPITIMGYRTTAMSAKFRCLCKAVDYYYDDGLEGTFQGSLTLGVETTTNSYAGHVFFFTEKGNKKKEIARYTMRQAQNLYVILDKKNPPPASYLEHIRKEEQFSGEYFNRTGILWRHYFGPDGKPRPPPTLFMWSAPSMGYKHNVVSNHGFWQCSGSSATCQSKEKVQMELEVASLAPRAFLIPSFLSDFESDAIIKLSKPQIKESLVGEMNAGGARHSDTRTSKNAWIKRSSDDITETLYRRAADLLQLDEKLLHSHTNAEDMQVVHYQNGQKYDSHHDWGVSGYPESRFITLLLYLTDPVDSEAGGETSFPKGADGLGFKVTPRKGSAVLFYNLLEDGNGDDLALHAALPVW
eukprot:CAMPEP_0119036200 /NCGR_PEP_ID=MMETSP1177-20130426/3728_1 /TAXON_ID=2985 /ORGANISM="Ochromonas sp, Strain CCMP1899" /LENGTH=495 /DNA_ID=CAMNT_0006995645 /DNA_START=160 /DNA_END=1644 /DNA_ORIENTATION=-